MKSKKYCYYTFTIAEFVRNICYYSYYIKIIKKYEI